MLSSSTRPRLPAKARSKISYLSYGKYAVAAYRIRSWRRTRDVLAEDVARAASRCPQAGHSAPSLLPSEGVGNSAYWNVSKVTRNNPVVVERGKERLKYEAT